MSRNAFLGAGLGGTAASAPAWQSPLTVSGLDADQLVELPSLYGASDAPNVLLVQATLPSGYVDALASITGQIAAMQEQVSAIRTEMSQDVSSPQTAWLATLDTEALRLRLPLPVEVHSADGAVAVFSADLDVFAEGEDVREALDVLRQVIAKEFRFLVDNAEHLGPGPARQLARFREVLLVG